MDLDSYPPDTVQILSALAERSARDRRSAVPVTVLAQQTGLDREAVQTRCEQLMADGHIDENTWEDGDEVLAEYYIDNENAFYVGRQGSLE